ncbi:hypothetical protein W823_14505 [Williamsia sp. D3]|nr:hypothetical protein W823_14505 [Williamsia sp. D3]
MAALCAGDVTEKIIEERGGHVFPAAVVGHLHEGEAAWGNAVLGEPVYDWA